MRCWLVQLAESATVPSDERHTVPGDMPRKQALPPISDQFRATAIAERESLLEMYRECQERHGALLEQAAQIAQKAERYLKTIRELGELLGLEEQLSIHELSDELRGERLRQVAADVVFRHFKKGGPAFHYREWLELVVAEGHRIGGKNSNATFLTQASRVEGVERVGRRTGLYRIAA